MHPHHQTTNLGSLYRESSFVKWSLTNIINFPCKNKKLLLKLGLIDTNIINKRMINQLLSRSQRNKTRRMFLPTEVSCFRIQFHSLYRIPLFGAINIWSLTQRSNMEKFQTRFKAHACTLKVIPFFLQQERI